MDRPVAYNIRDFTALDQMTTDRDYKALYHLSRALHNQQLDKEGILSQVLSRAGEITSVVQGCLVTFNDDDTIDNAYVLDQHGAIPNDFWDALFERGLIGHVYHSQRIVEVPNIAVDPRWTHVPDGPDSGSAIGLPLQAGLQVFGVLMLIHDDIDYFTDATIALLKEIADLASTAISNAVDYTAAQTGDVRYHHLFDGAVVPVTLTDLNGKILDVNPRMCDFLGYERAQLLGAPVTTLHGISDQIMPSGGLGKLPHNDERTYTTTAFKLDRAEIPVSVRVRRLRIHGRDVLEWVLQDATAQMALEQLRADLSAMVYHDLRGPLQSINGSINRLAKVIANHENPAVLTLLQIATQSTRQLRRLIDSLLDVRRLEDDKAILDCQPMELRVLLTDAAQLVQQLIFESGQKMRFDFPSNLPMVYVDGDMMVRVVINLLENATKYTPQGGIIRLGANLDEDEGVVRIYVSDSGPGIPYHLQHQIFDKFNRVKYRNAPQGIGLGLAFCRLAVEAHGGNIWVESEPGDGCDFIFTLPLKPELTGEESGDTVSV